jgi:transposase InsO family protein
MTSISIDTMGPFPVDKDGNIYIIVIVDNFSRYTELFPAADCTAASAADAVLRHISFFGCPLEILSDNGTQFVNQLMDVVAKRFSIRLRRTTPYSHEENGIVERANKEVLRHLRAIMSERTVKDDWSFCTPLVQRIIDATVHSTHGFAPATIVTPGIDLNTGILYPLTAGQNSEECNHEFIQKLDEHYANIVRLVTQRLAARKAIRLQKSKGSARPVTEYLPGSFVLVAYPKGTRAPTKLHMPWAGPMQVVTNNNSEYVLRNLVTGKTMIRHVSNLKAFIPSKVSPLQVASRDAEAYIVEKIISHEGNTRRKEQMLFRVRWFGFGPDEDTKEPWSNLKHNWLLHRYLREAGLKHLIPIEYREEVENGRVGLQGVALVMNATIRA